MKQKRFYYLPKTLKAKLSTLDFADRQMNTIAKYYYIDDSFCRVEKQIVLML